MLANLLNTSGQHADANVMTIGEIDPLGPLDITLRLPEKPQRVTLEPGGEAIAGAKKTEKSGSSFRASTSTACWQWSEKTIQSPSISIRHRRNALP